MTRALTRLLRFPAIRAAIERAAFQAARDIAARARNTPWHQATRRERLRARLYATFAHDLRNRIVGAAREARRGN